MFVVLDTNHYDELANDSAFGRNARRRIESHLADVFISVVSVQESVQGWMALINRKRPGHEQVHAYARFQTGGWNSCATMIETERGECPVISTILKRASFLIIRP